MIQNAIVWVGDPALMMSRILGLTLIERHLFLLSRSGIRRVWVTMDRPAAPLRIPRELDIYWSASVMSPAELKAPFALISSKHILQKQQLLAIFSKDHPESTCWLDDTGHPAIQVINSPGDLEPSASHPLKEAIGAGRKLDASTYVFVRCEDNTRAAAAKLLGHARKASDGLMAHYFDRAISLRISTFLLDTPVTPNMMTLVSTAIGVIGGLQFFWADYPHFLAGALLIWLHTVLDGCDGEMARLAFRESKWGAIWDFWGDNVVHVVLFASMACGLSNGADAMRWLGISAGVGSFGSALLTYSTNFSQSQSKVAGVRDTLRRIEILLAQRDFIYLLVACAVFNRIHWFVWATGVGAPIYFMVMIYLQQWTKPSAVNIGDTLSVSPGLTMAANAASREESPA